MLADIYYEQKKYDKAEAILEKAIRLEPTYAEPYTLRARCYQETGRYDEAIEDYYSAMVAEPEYADFYFSIARVCELKGDSAARQQAIDRGLELYRIRRDSLGMNEYRGMGDLNKACEVALEKMKPTSTDNYIYNTACVLALAGRTEEALDYLEKSMEKGFMNITHIKHDEDFVSLRDNPKFKELIVTYTAKTKEMQQYVNDQLAK
jgi:tetratricopeptide (TPR) repeat protein